MYRVIECLTQEHDYRLVAIAALVCVVGSCLTVIVTRRMVVARGSRQRFQLFLAGLLGGATIWSTHFIAMLAYDPGVSLGYEPVVTAISLGVAVSGLLGANALLVRLGNATRFLAAGSLFGLTVSAMHYVGMSALLVPGQITWSAGHAAASVLLGTGLGAAAYHRILFPITRYCWLGGAFLMVLSICAMHFTGMAAVSIELSPLVEASETVMPNHVLGLAVFAVTAIILFVGFVGVNIETSLEREALAKIEETASHDALTGLPNRLLLSRRLRDCARWMGQDRTRRAALLTINLKLFKEVNDLHGHAAGDAVLIETARRLSAACEDDEFIARAGGDEFVALKSGFRRVDEVRAFANRLSASMTEPIYFQDMELTIGAAIGIATSVEDGSDLDDLMQKSDLAMYRAKADFDTGLCFYNAERDQQNRDRLQLVSDLRQAAERGEFELVYQLQNDVTSLKPIGFEVLLRWNHGTRGRISPADFIPLAEETGLIRDIGLWVLRSACMEATRWSKPFSIAVNVAPQQLAQPSFLEELSDILMESRLAPQRLELEVTEASIIDDQVYTLKVMHRIKEMGVRIAMDDFGTGYSSLATLQAFPFDKIKIDRSFIQDVHKNHQRAAIVRATLLLGEALDIPVLAEGVEDQTELDFLKREKCQYVQGFFFGQPMSGEELAALVQPEAADRAS